MNLFLNTSVLIAACASATGASRELFDRATGQGWRLLTCPYIGDEVDANIGRFPPDAAAQWARLRPALWSVPNVLTMDRPVVFGPSKDRPVLFTAEACADVLLTLDLRDFGPLLNSTFYGLAVFTPGDFLRHERDVGRLQ